MTSCNLAGFRRSQPAPANGRFHPTSITAEVPPPARQPGRVGPSPARCMRLLWARQIQASGKSIINNAELSEPTHSGSQGKILQTLKFDVSMTCWCFWSSFHLHLLFSGPGQISSCSGKQTAASGAGEAASPRHMTILLTLTAGATASPIGPGKGDQISGQFQMTSPAGQTALVWF